MRTPLERRALLSAAAKSQGSSDLGKERHVAYAEMLAAHVEGPPTEEALRAVYDEVRRTVSGSGIPSGMSYEVYESSMRDMISFSVGSAYWAKLGRPAFNLTLDFFRAIAVTDFGDTAEQKLHLPFPAFLIRYPEPLGSCEAMSAFVYPCFAKVQGVEMEPKLCVYRMSLGASKKGVDGPFTQWVEGVELGPFLHAGGRPLERIDPVERIASEELGAEGDTARRATDLQLARMVLGNLTSYINESGGLPSTKKTGPDVPVEREHATEPRFRVGRPIRLGPQLRDALRPGQTKEGWKLAQRFVVRGHWRNQAYGPERSLRRKQWIQPFWKGPEDMTAALKRTYEVE